MTIVIVAKPKKALGVGMPTEFCTCRINLMTAVNPCRLCRKHILQY